jgi:Sec-independent protein translocase protein TatA
VVGPGDLPKIARWLAKTLKRIRGTIKQFTDALNMEDDLREVKEAGKMLKDTIHDLNPAAEVTDEIEKFKRETKKELNVLGDLTDLKNISLTDEKKTEKPPKDDGLKQEA